MTTAIAAIALVLGTLLPGVASAQPGGKVPRIGYLTLYPGVNDDFRRGLRDLGYVEGQTVVIESRHGGGRAERLAERARELVDLKVDVIFAVGVVDIKVALEATRTIPIVMGPYAGDPVRLGFVKSLAQPGGNVTGVSSMAPELLSKRVEFLREVRPGLIRIAVLWDLALGPVERMESVRPGWEAAARTFGITWHPVPVRGPQDLVSAFEAATRERVGAMMFGPDTQFLRGERARVAALALKHRLPAIADRDIYPEAGLLMAYGPDLTELHRRAAYYVSRILQGASPAELPVEQPSKFTLALNRKTAAALGLKIPPSLLLRADRVIE
jgi:putative ABC transport system substrate-binding protein